MRRFLALALVLSCHTSPETLGPDPETDTLSRVNDLSVTAPVSLQGTAPTAEGSPEFRFFAYQQVIDRVAGMARDDRLYARVKRRGLGIVDLTWEDTGRAMGSALGPNITDLTLQVRNKDPWGNWHTALMPVIRFDNFTDRTADIPADRFFVRVGNHKDIGDALETVPLTDVLKSIRTYASKPDDIKGSGDLSAQRDTHFLVSAQAVFLPISRSGKTEFNPVLFNYQSAPGSPAVLSILVMRQGTSMHVIENRPDDQSVAGWGQEVYFNNRGQRAAFQAERKSDVVRRIEEQGGPLTEDDRSALQKGADVMFLVQVPLIHAHRGVLSGLAPLSKMAAPTATFGLGTSGGPALKSADAVAGQGRASDVEQAVVGHGPNLGPFNEAHGLTLVRDARFPIRITVQFYKATSTGIVSEADLDAIKRSIDDVYEHADFVGSLVVPEGDPKRPTAWQTMPSHYFPW
jgi:hypothetical protein